MRSGSLRAILGAATLGGTLDLISAFWLFGHRGVSADQMLQSVASGLLGKAAYTKGSDAVALGFAAHYAIMVIIAAIYILPSRQWPVLWRRPIVAGTIYGLIVLVVMSYVVVPMSGAARWPDWTPVTLAHALIVHVVFVGWVVAWYASGQRRGQQR